MACLRVLNPWGAAPLATPLMTLRSRLDQDVPDAGHSGLTQQQGGMDGAVSVQKPVATGADENFGAHHLPAKAKPVSLRRKSTPDAGMQEENNEWLPYLTDGVGKGCAGRDPCRSRSRSSLHRGTHGDGRASLSTHSQKQMPVTCHGYRMFESTKTFAAMLLALRRWQRCRVGAVPQFIAPSGLTVGSNPHNPQRGAIHLQGRSSKAMPSPNATRPAPALAGSEPQKPNRRGSSIFTRDKVLDSGRTQEFEDYDPWLEKEKGNGKIEECESPKVAAIALDEFLSLDIPPRETMLAPWLPRRGLAMIHARAVSERRK